MNLEISIHGDYILSNEMWEDDYETERNISKRDVGKEEAKGEEEQIKE